MPTRKDRNSEPMQLIGARIRQLRLRAGISQEQLANDADMARSYMTEVEAGRRNISVVLICEIARVLQVPPSQLLRFDRVKQPKAPSPPKSSRKALTQSTVKRR
jgi:transcriptional regulator with XRE-family HTH domain